LFSGIISQLGQVTALEQQGEDATLTVAAKDLDGLRPGDSMAVNGACLTLVELIAPNRKTAVSVPTCPPRP